MTETTPAAIRVGDEYAAQLAEFSDEWTEIHRQQAVLDARKARLLARSAAYADTFADATVPATFPPAERRALSRRSTCAALAMATRTPERTVQLATNDAERLVNDAPAVLASLEAGRISARHAQVITDQLCDVPAAGRAVFLDRVLVVAERTTAAGLRTSARVLRERLHPESITARATRSEADRRVEFEPEADGMAWVLLFTTAPIAQGIIERVEAAASESRAAGYTRTCAQLQADALAALALTGVTPEDVMSSPVLPHPIEVQERIKPTVQITVPALSMAGVSDAPAMLDGYGPIDPETAARIAVNAPSFTRILVQPETGAVLSVGRNQYRVPADLQRAVRLRDGTCRAPGCGRRARACDLDHSVAWEDGGTTDVGNLACLCRHHHRMKHLPGWNLDHKPGGVLEWTTSDGKHHRTEPDPAPF
ncbi:HNH endonuclease signature motif containing protein [Plantibacter cousiniae (nom. nud.)]|uniref:HNH endonuclease n=1 Tax=Plantibacter cousiniae (nom. nud.) TaxID=199709 RepID=A0ABY1LK14_9MICO|nr:HNH endonuclease signature motif containing protein [Plantibacter cousiniae]SKC51689.1 HNH endonuclease [Plantibacter cousiniae]